MLKLELVRVRTPQSAGLAYTHDIPTVGTTGEQITHHHTATQFPAIAHYYVTPMVTPHNRPQHTLSHTVIPLLNLSQPPTNWELPKLWNGRIVDLSYGGNSVNAMTNRDFYI